MQPTLFTMPLKPGKKQMYLDFINTITSEKVEEYRDLLKRYNLNSATLWIADLSWQRLCDILS